MGHAMSNIVDVGLFAIKEVDVKHKKKPHFCGFALPSGLEPETL